LERIKNMTMGPETKIDCVGEDQQQFTQLTDRRCNSVTNIFILPIKERRIC
jgi:hypothetical protein